MINLKDTPVHTLKLGIAKVKVNVCLLAHKITDCNNIKTKLELWDTRGSHFHLSCPKKDITTAKTLECLLTLSFHIHCWLFVIWFYLNGSAATHSVDTDKSGVSTMSITLRGMEKNGEMPDPNNAHMLHHESALINSFSLTGKAMGDWK